MSETLSRNRRVSDHSTPSPRQELDEATAAGLRRRNLLFGCAHLVSGVVMLVLANDFSLPVTTTFLDGPPGGEVDPSRLVNEFDVRLAWGTAGFLFLSALFHFVIASPLGYRTYLDELRHHRNRFRWVEYSLSASLMIVLIAMIVGISDATALIAIGGVNAAMILFGWLMEMASDPADDAPVWWTPFWFGCIAGAVPWVAVGVYLLGPGSAVPNFVYGIFFSIFVFFNCFAVNQFLQYRRVGPWRDYVFGEKTYVWLSITAKSVLAWQIYANTLAG